MGATGPHFSERELRCRHCGVNETRPELVAALEKLRAAVGGPVVLRSAYRCPVHNRRVGGVAKSQHLYGFAADLRDGISERRVRALKLFSGIGVADGLVVHVDVRHVNRKTNTTGGTPERPTRWTY